MKKIMKVKDIKPNPNNPRVVVDAKFEKLKKSIEEFPEMMDARPLVVNQDGVVLGGNMRLKAIKALGWKEAPVMVANWDEQKNAEFIIKDNVSFGEWNWELLSSQWDTGELQDWGLEVWKPSEEPDYSILDEEDLEDELADMEAETRKAIQIEFMTEHYEEAQSLIKFWREQEAYIGGMIIEHLKAAKENL